MGAESIHLKKIDAVIWDMDGVLLDSEPLSFEAVTRTAEAHGMTYSPETNKAFFGMTDRDVFNRLTKEFGCRVPIEQLVEQAARTYLQIVAQRPLGLRPGVAETLEQFASWGLKQAVASSSNPLRISRNLEMLGITRYMAETVSGMDMKRGKPHPDIFLTAAARVGVAPERCLAIEDSEAGVASAVAAGMICVAFPCESTRQAVHQGARVRVEDLRQVDWRSLIGGEPPNAGS